MAGVYYRQGEYTKALELYEKSLAIRLQSLGPDHPDTNDTYKNMTDCIPPLCHMLEDLDAEIVPAALEILDNILKIGATMAESSPTGENAHALAVKRAHGLERIANLQNHKNNDISERAVRILETYFGAVDEEAA